MALVSLYDPYEWVDPEKGRLGVLIHTSQIGPGIPEDRWVDLGKLPKAVFDWTSVWAALDKEKETLP